MALGSPNNGSKSSDRGSDGILRGTSTSNSKVATRRTNNTVNNNNNSNSHNKSVGRNNHNTSSTNNNNNNNSNNIGINNNNNNLYYNSGGATMNNNNNNNNNNINNNIEEVVEENVRMDDTIAAWNSKTHASLTEQADDASLLQQINAKSSAALLVPNVTVTLYVPTSSVGALIGWKGQNISQLQKIASEKSSSSLPVRVSVVSRGGEHQQSTHSDGTMALVTATGTAHLHSTHLVGSSNPSLGLATNTTTVPTTYTDLDWSDPTLTPVVVRAEPAAAMVATTIVQEIVNRHKLQVQLSSSSGQSLHLGNGSPPTIVIANPIANPNENDYCSYEDDIIVDVPISRHKHAAIVGKRGMVVATISSDFGVRIMVPPPQSSLSSASSEKNDIIQLEGSLPNVKRCLLKIMQIASTTYTNLNNKLSVDDINNKGPHNINNHNNQNSQSNHNNHNNHNSISNHNNHNIYNSHSTNDNTNNINNNNNSNINSKKQQGNNNHNNATTTTTSDGRLCHQQTIVLMIPIPPTKMRNICHKTDTSIKKKKKVDDGFLYSVSSILTNSTTATALTIQQQRMMVENNVNAAVALLQKWNSDNLTAAAMKLAAPTPAPNPSSDSSSNGAKAPKRTGNMTNNNNSSNNNSNINNNNNNNNNNPSTNTNNRGGSRGTVGNTTSTTTKSQPTNSASNMKRGGGGNHKSKQQSGTSKENK